MRQMQDSGVSYVGQAETGNHAAAPWVLRGRSKEHVVCPTKNARAGHKRDKLGTTQTAAYRPCSVPAPRRSRPFQRSVSFSTMPRGGRFEGALGHPGVERVADRGTNPDRFALRLLIGTGGAADSRSPERPRSEPCEPPQRDDRRKASTKPIPCTGSSAEAQAEREPGTGAAPRPWMGWHRFWEARWITPRSSSEFCGASSPTTNRFRLCRTHRDDTDAWPVSPPALRRASPWRPRLPCACPREPRTGPGHSWDRLSKDAKGRDRSLFQSECGFPRLGPGPRLPPPGLR